MLRVSREAVRLMAHAGVLMGERTVSGQWLFRQSVVMELVVARAKASVRSRAAVYRSAHLRLVHRQIAPRQLELFTARGGVAPAAEGRKVTWRSPRKTSPLSRKNAPGLISAAMSPGEGPKHMAKVEEPHGRTVRRANSHR
jgi:hypothetical protein